MILFREPGSRQRLPDEVVIGTIDNRRGVATVFRCHLGYGARVTRTRLTEDGPEAVGATVGKAGWSDPGEAWRWALEQLGLSGRQLGPHDWQPYGGGTGGHGPVPHDELCRVCGALASELEGRQPCPGAALGSEDEELYL